MFPIIAQYELGDRGKKALCLEHDLKMPTFDYWLRKFREEESEQYIEPSFVSLDIVESSSVIEISIGNGTIRFAQYPPVEYLRSLLAEV